MSTPPPLADVNAIVEGFLAARRAKHGDLRMEATEAPPADAAATDAAPAQEAKPEIDWKAKSREWEAKAKANKAAADKLAEIEEANKTEAQRTAERLAAAEKAAQDARAEALRLRIATRFQISDEDADLFLTGADEETLTKQAERLSQRVTDRKKQGNTAPREGGNPNPSDSKGDLRDFARQLFNTAD